MSFSTDPQMVVHFMQNGKRDLLQPGPNLYLRVIGGIVIRKGIQNNLFIIKVEI